MKKYEAMVQELEARRARSAMFKWGLWVGLILGSGMTLAICYYAVNP